MSANGTPSHDLPAFLFPCFAVDIFIKLIQGNVLIAEFRNTQPEWYEEIIGLQN